MNNVRHGLTNEDLDGRLNCFGEFDGADSICTQSCALCLNCAIAKNRFLGFQLMEDSSTAMPPYDLFEVE